MYYIKLYYSMEMRWLNKRECQNRKIRTKNKTCQELRQPRWSTTEKKIGLKIGNEKEEYF